MRHICKAFLIILALTINMDLQEGEKLLDLLLQSLQGLNLIYGVLLYLFVRLLQYSDRAGAELKRRKKWESLCYELPACFFSFCMVFGYSFYKSNSWNLVFCSHVQLLKCLIAFAGYYCLFRAVILCIFAAADKVIIADKKTIQCRGILGWYLKCLEAYPFRTAFLTLLIWSIPYMVLSYPGIFTCDTKIQLDNGYRALVYGTSQLRNQHPVIHTLLLVGSTLLGNCFSSANAGLFLLSLTQALFTMGAVAWTVAYLCRCRVSVQWLAAVLAFFMLNPRLQNYLFVLVKDVWYALFMMIFVVELHRILTGRCPEGKKKRMYLGILIASAAGVFFFRQDGIYVLIPTALAAGILYKKHRRLFFCLFVSVCLLSVIYQKGILPACNVANNNTRQMFSIPFQQTARYVKEAGEDVTKAEAEAIAGVLDYENLGELYNPNLSDPVKSTFNKEATGKEIGAYLKVWLQMFFKHPGIYIQATMNNLYGYFYPDGYTTLIQDYGTSQEYMQECNEHNKELNLQLCHPERFAGAREGMEYLREMLFTLPVLSICNLSATYIWILFLLIFYGIRKRDKNGLMLLLPLFVVFLVCMAGPTYGWYFRYMYSIVMCLPAVLVLNLTEHAECACE